MERFRVSGPGIVKIDYSWKEGLTCHIKPIENIDELASVGFAGNLKHVEFIVLGKGIVEADDSVLGKIANYRFIPDPHSFSRGKRLSNSGETNKATHEDSVTHCSHPTLLILFIKADAISLIDTIKNKNALYEGAESTLFIDAFKMWVGTEEQYRRVNVKDEFHREESKNSFVKEYDYVAMRFQLCKAYKGYRRGDDSYERNQFFTDICKDRIQLIECSKRLSFDEGTKTDAYDVY